MSAIATLDYSYKSANKNLINSLSDSGTRMLSELIYVPFIGKYMITQANHQNLTQKRREIVYVNCCGLTGVSKPEKA
jgi:hypothetical protein